MVESYSLMRSHWVLPHSIWTCALFPRLPNDQLCVEWDVKLYTPTLLAQAWAFHTFLGLTSNSWSDVFFVCSTIDDFRCQTIFDRLNIIFAFHMSKLTQSTLLTGFNPDSFLSSAVIDIAFTWHLLPYKFFSTNTSAYNCPCCQKVNDVSRKVFKCQTLVWDFISKECIPCSIAFSIIRLLYRYCGSKTENRVNGEWTEVLQNVCIAELWCKDCGLANKYFRDWLCSGWVILRLNFRLKGYVSRQYLWTGGNGYIKTLLLGFSDIETL